jgi:hypothetical protein
LHQYSPLDQNHTTLPFIVENGVVTHFRDNWITQAVAQAFDSQSSDADMAQFVWERMQAECDVRSPLNGAVPSCAKHVLPKVRYARRKLKDRQDTRDAPIPNVYPDYVANPLKLDVAEALMQEALVDFLDSLPFWQHADVDTDAMSASELLTYVLGDSWRAMDSRTISKNLRAAANTAAVARRLLLPAAAGLGKTRTLLRALASWFQRAKENPSYRKVTIHFACPTAQLCDEAAAFYRSQGGRCATPRGRTFSRKGDGSDTLCAKPLEVTAFMRSGIGGSVTEHMCASFKDGTPYFCEHFQGCPYHAQFDGDADIQFITHDHLFNVMSHDSYGRADLLVIDESPLPKLVTATQLIAPYELAHDTFGQIVIEAMKASKNPWIAFEEAGLSIKDVRQRITALAVNDKPPDIYPGMNAKRLHKLLDANTGYRPDKLIRVLTKIVDEWATRREGPIRCLSYSPAHRVKAGDSDTTAPMLFLTYRKQMMSLRKDLPVLVLDATGMAALLEPSIPGLVQGRRIEVERNASVLQVTGNRGSMGKLRGDDSRYRDEASAVERRFSGPYGGALLATIKDAVAKGLKHTHENGATAHYGGVRGLNKFEHLNCVILTGRIEQSPLDLEQTAKALLYDDPRPLTLTQRFNQILSGYDFADRGEAPKGRYVSRHVDPFIDALRFQTCEAEIIQMIDRCRFARKTTCGLIVLLTEIPIPGVIVDLLMPYKDLVDRDRPGKRLRTAYEMLGALPPANMLVNVMDEGAPLWPSVAAVQQDMKRVGDIEALLKAQCYKFKIKGKRGAPSLIYAACRLMAEEYLAKTQTQAELI